MNNPENALILIVDDNITDLSFLEKVLQENKYKTITAKNGKEAITTAEKHQPDAILLDVMLPKKNGIQVLEDLISNEKTKDIPVIMVSIKDKDKTLQKTLEIGAMDYIKKPISVIELKARLKTSLKLKKKELKLKESEMKYKLLIEQANDGIIITDAKTGKIINANKKASALIGLPRRELKGLKQIEIHPEKNNKIYADYFLVGKKKDLALTEETLIINYKTKKEIPVEISINTLDFGEQKLIQSILRDMREHKNYEQSLEKSKALYKGIVEDQTEMICRYNTSLKITFMNNSYRRYFNITGNSFIGESIFHNVKRKFTEKIKQKLNSLTYSKPVVTYEYKVVRSLTAKPRWINRTDRAVFDKDKRIIEYQSVLRDITVNKLYKEELVSKFEFISYIAEMSPAGILSVNKQGRITFHNKNVVELFGFSQSKNDFPRNFNKLNFYDLPSKSILNKENNPLSIIAKTKKQLLNAQYLIKEKDRSKYIAINGSPMMNKDGEIESVIFSINNISKHKDIEQKLNEKTKLLEKMNNELETLSYSLSHDLKNSVSNIKIASEFLKKHYYDNFNEEGKSVLDSIYEVNNYMSELINGILNLFVLTKNDINYNEINVSVISESIMIKLKKFSPQRNIVYHIEPNITVEGDLNMIKVLIENLLYNAWKFTKEKDVSRINIGKTQDKNNNTFFIQDNGTGFDTAKHSDKIFNTFYRINSSSKFKGSGIGLSTVKKIVEKHKGKIRVESKPNEGTTFYISLPKVIIDN